MLFRSFAYDVITDHDLHREGADLLRQYKCVLTGSHPEYHTPETLNAVRDYTATGGRLCYLGGNGFYWRIAVSAQVLDVVEVRRAEGGIRAWAAEPGEYYHALDGMFGGLWRRNGRPPRQRLIWGGPCPEWRRRQRQCRRRRPHRLQLHPLRPNRQPLQQVAFSRHGYRL